MATRPNSIFESDRAIEQALDKRRKELEADYRAFERYKAMRDTALANENERPAPTLFPLTPPEESESNSFAGHVRRVALDFGSKTFTVPMVEQELMNQNIPLPGNNKSRQRISMALKKMYDRKLIVRVKEGYGNEPHVYRVA